MSFFQSLLEDSNRDLFLVIGNSTSGAGTNGSTGAGPTPTANTAFYYRRSNNTVIQIGANDLEFASDPPSNGSQWPKFAIDYYTKMNRKAVIIPSGVAGSTFASDGVDDNDWSTTGDNYALAVSDAQATMTITGISRLTAIFVFEGINDANTVGIALGDVQTAIASLVSRLHSDFPNVPIVFCQIGTLTGAQTNARSAAIRKYIKDTCISDPLCFLLGGMLSAFSAGYYTDDFHLNQTGQNAIGAIFARWFQNRNYGKWSRSIISSHHSDLSALRKDLIAPIDNLLTDYLNHEMLYFFVQPVEPSIYLDWAFTCVFNNGIGGSVPTMDWQIDSDLHTAASGESARPGWAPSLSGLISSQNDVFFAVKIKTATTALNTFATVYGGLNTGSTIGHFLAQTNASALRYRINDVTNTDYTGQTKFQDDTEYLVSRDGTTKALWINGSQVHSATQASTGVFNASSNLSSNNNIGTANSFYEGAFEWVRAGKHTTTDQAAFYAFLENIKDHWND